MKENGWGSTGQPIVKITLVSVCSEVMISKSQLQRGMQQTENTLNAAPSKKSTVFPYLGKSS